MDHIKKHAHHRAFTHTCMHSHSHTRTETFMHARMHAHTHKHVVFTHSCKHARTRIHKNTHKNTCTHTYMYRYTLTHARTNTRIHARAKEYFRVEHAPRSAGPAGYRPSSRHPGGGWSTRGCGSRSGGNRTVSGKIGWKREVLETASRKGPTTTTAGNRTLHAGASERQHVSTSGRGKGGRGCQGGQGW